MKKIIVITVTVFLLLFVLTACTVQETEIIPPDIIDTLPPADTDGDIDNNQPDEIIPPDNEQVPMPDNPPDEVIKPVTVSYIRSKANSLNIRLKPSTSSTILGSIDKGELLIYHGINGGYYITRFKEKTAYISASKTYTEVITLNSSENTAIEKALSIGSELMGKPYELGAERLHWGNGIMNKNFTGNTYDCSSLMQYMYYKSNKTLLDVTTRKQVLQGVSVSRKNLKRGDLLFFTNSYRYNFSGVERIGHVGVYLGDNYMLHTASDHALIEPISSNRWSYYVTARRVIA